MASTASDIEITVAPDEGDAPLLPAIKVEEPITITIFGASGDLTQRKLIPALYAMYRQNLLPKQFAIVGYARRDWDDAHFRSLMSEALRAFSRIEVTDESLSAFLQHVCYHMGDLYEHECYLRFKERLKDREACPGNRLFYLSVTPSLFETVVERLEDVDLISDVNGTPWSRVVIEKPFGRDYDSAHELNRRLLKHLDESQIFRIDHYLGKETVQNILSFRFANAIFEPVFNNRYVDHIQITAAETVGMESGRGAYYDATGAVRDMMQNHILQLLCLVMMDPPSSMRADAIHNEKVKVLQSIRPIRPGELGALAVRGQYATGTLGGGDVPGYLQEDRIDPASRTETYAAIRLSVDSWRWAQVPIYLRTGKRLKRRTTEIAVQFKVPPLQLFQTVECVGDVCDLSKAKPNTLIFRIQPDEGISLQFSAKRPVLQVQVENVAMKFHYAQTWQRSVPEAYERLLLDVMRGDSTLFMRSDEVEAAWRVVDPVLHGWAHRDDMPVYAYESGSWGPPAANALFDGTEAEWINP